MCGVIGLVYERRRDDLGVVAGELLRTLEYRGYDSTGAAIQGEDEDVTLRKDVGAPSVMAERLGILELGGRVLCAQVRWATFGAVDRENAQPHVVRCHTFLYGAHNGNVTNCDVLKQTLLAEGHDVRSDNDGEMLVHAVEHEFAARLAALPEERRRDPQARGRAMREAVTAANARLEGSYAAVVVDPVTRRLCAIKKGSSLYFGVGEHPVGGRFAIASSDMSSVLKLTRMLVPLSEGEFVEFDGSDFAIYRFGGGPDGYEPLERAPARSRLRAQDTELRAGFTTFMEQEIHDQIATSRNVARIFGGGSAASRAVAPIVEAWSDAERAAVDGCVEALFEQRRGEAMLAQLERLAEEPAFAALCEALPAGTGAAEGEVAGGAGAVPAPYVSLENAFLEELATYATTDEQRRAARAIDALGEHDEVASFAAAVDGFCRACLAALERSSRVYVVCCGTSFHAAKVAALFFAELARVELLALLPGEFRGQHAATLRDGDVVVAVSQSGETKDVVDVLNDVIASGRDVTRIAIVNNTNSTLAQEKCSLIVPLRCGPEIAVPATKSFLNQLMVFYGLALELAARRARAGAEVPEPRHGLDAIPALIERTLAETAPAVAEAAEHLFLAPSLHLLATRLLGIAKEGALKVREVVINHTEGFEGSEFKHGPNTILGFSTVFGPRQLDALLAQLGDDVARVLGEAGTAPGEDATVAAVREVFGRRGAALDELAVDYPLVYITGPDPRDVALTVSQINTHKIRGASTIVVAEEDAALRGAAEKGPANNPGYRSIYVPLPCTGDVLMTAFSATVALQRLALEMSTRKLEWLDARGIAAHGVHPDVPKNVSKSITVD